MGKEIFVTKEGLALLNQELMELKTVKRPEIIEALKDARAQGDLSENSEYDAARDAQSEIENRIREIEKTLERAKLVTSVKKDKVSIGNEVTIEYVADGEEDHYYIVGSTEADPFNNKISNESPIAKAILNKKVGDVVSVESPAGNYQVQIMKIA